MSVPQLDEAKVSQDFADMFDAEKRRVDAWLIEHLDLRSGDVVLETACGTAGTGMAIAATLGTSGRVICSDRSERMLDAARAVACTRGIVNVDFRVLDAERLALPSRSVDGVVCRLGFQVMHDVRAALREAHRVLRSRRRLALGVWSERERNPWQAVPEDVLGVPRPSGGDGVIRPGPFALASEELLRSLLSDTGFTAVRVDRVRADQQYSSLEQFWTICMSKARRPREAFDRLDPAQRAAAKRDILERLAACAVRGEAELVIPAEMLVAAGERRD